MPRPLRIHVPHGFYHATLRGNHCQDIFRHDRERSLLNIIVARALEVHGAQVHAYCWMTNHLHLVVRVGQTPLGHLMRQIGSEYARAFQANLGTTGHLFENRYYATLIDTDAYLLEVVRYVHQNPVRAGLVSNPAHYPWSSHTSYLGVNPTPWVTTAFALNLLSRELARATVLYRAFVDSLPAAAIAEELVALEKGVPVIGRTEFISDLAPVAGTNFSLQAVLAKACKNFGVTDDQLRSQLRSERLVKARAWIAFECTRKGGMALSEIARELKRDQSTLRSGMRKYAKELMADPAALSLLSPPGTTTGSTPASGP